MRHSYGSGSVVFDGIDLSIAAGSFVAVLGPSGCGKSTLLRLISGLDSPMEGVLTVAGRKLIPGAQHKRGTGLPPGELAFVFQEPHLLPWRSVLDNVALPLELRGIDRTEARRRAAKPLADVELAQWAENFPDQLSGGMRMRVSIARALVTEPRILLLDEPFAALDELTRQRLDEKLRNLWLDKHMTVIFVTHSLVEAAFLAERALVLSKRPARIVLDHDIALPRERAAAVRSSVAFVEQTSALYRALEQYGATDETPRS